MCNAGKAASDQMGKGRRLSEAWTILTVSALMVLALAVLARDLVRNKERADALGSMVVGRALDRQRLVFDLVVRTYDRDAREEATYLMENAETTAQGLLRRWMPVLRSRYAIRAIGLADEQGDEYLLQRVDSLWRFTATRRETGQQGALEVIWPIRDGIEVADSSWNGAHEDPRRSEWFSQALEERNDGPSWSMAPRDGNGLLHLSQLLRGRDGAYQVLHFDMDPAIMFSGTTLQAAEVSAVLLTDDGRSVSAPDTGLMGRAWSRTLAGWSPPGVKQEQQVEMDGRRFEARILPYDLGGVHLYLGILVGFGPLDHWNAEGRMALWSVVGLLVLLGVLLTVLYLQYRNAARKELRQARRSDQQARHLAQAIGERESLDREVHHRVKNNLQVVSSLLNLQAQRIPVPDTRNEFLRGKRRIDSMALVHHKLYRQKDLDHVDLGVFLNDIAVSLSAMFDPDSRQVTHSVEDGGIRMDADTSIQLGMIACELLANCHQHAFAPSTAGHIKISVRDAGGGNYVLSVADNGKGATGTALHHATLGMEVVEALAEQVDGKVRKDQRNGTVVEVSFRSIARYAGSG
jgi:two-component sensor histidine kinase